MADNPGHIQGTPFDDVLTGTDLNEWIEGLLGNDRLYGMGGSDQLWGAGGDDLYDGGEGHDYAQFFKSNMWIRVDLAIKGPQDTNEGRDTFVSIEGILGSPLNDDFRGDDAYNEIHGADGDDFIDGRGGDDFLVGGAGADEIHGGGGADSITGGDGNDRLFGGAGDDRFWVGFGVDLYDGGEGVDSLVFSLDSGGVTVDLSLATRQEFAPSMYGTLTSIERVSGTRFADTLLGDARDNIFDSGAGDDIVDGRGGNDTYVVGAWYKDLKIQWTVDGWRITDTSSSGFAQGSDLVRNVETLQAADVWTHLGDGMPLIVRNILRLEDTEPNSPASQLSLELAAGRITPQAALNTVIEAADATTSVASLNYQFFTGKTPSVIGIDFLVAPTGPNASNLNSEIYAKFNTVNRYINFAANLGKYGEAKDSFAAKYGSMTLAEATKSAYATIFGGTPTDAKVAQLLEGRVDFLASFTGDGSEGIGTKAAMVGFLLAAAALENVGVMARSNAAWLADLADGEAPFAVDLINPANGYYKADFIFGG